MSYSSNKNLLSTTGVAVLASLGIHGLLWVVLPGLTIDSQANKSPSQRTIGLVELSPTEQSRLPQTNPADNTLPSFATQPSQLPPIPPAPPYQTSVMPPLQLPSSSAPVYNPSPEPNSAPAPQTFQVFLPPPPTITSFVPSPSENLPNSPNFYPTTALPPAPPFVLPPNDSLPNIPLTADRTLPSEDNIATAIPSPEPSLQPTPTNPLAPTPNPSVEANKLPERGKKELLAMRDSMRNNFPSSAATTTNTRTLSRQEIITALKGQTRNLSNELSEEAKTAQNNLDKFNNARQRVLSAYPNAVTKPPIRRKLVACDRTQDDLAILSVVVNPEGKRLSEPVLITEPRRANLTQAQRYVRDYEFAKTGKTTNYNFRLEFDYNASKCAQAKPTPAPTSIPKPTPSTTTPTPAPSRTPSTPRPTPTPTPAPSRTPSTPRPTPSPTTTSTPRPTPSPTTTSTPRPTPAPSPTTTSTPRPTPTTTSTPRPKPTPTPDSTAEPSPTPASTTTP